MLIADDALPDLPVRSLLPGLRESLAGSGAAVLVAPPGTGKTTLVPLALPGRVVVAEPRRLAARAAARRMASLIGERPGGRVGYTVRGDRQVSRSTTVEVVTTGVLVRRLQRDPELAGTATVILDECHERHLDTDLALAFLIEARAALRPDLHLLATSATADAGRLAALLGGAPVLAAESRLFPVEVHWAPPPGQITPPHGLRVDPRLLDHVAATTRRALAEGDGDVLVFLPGAREIELVAARLAGSGESDLAAARSPIAPGADAAAARPALVAGTDAATTRPALVAGTDAPTARPAHAPEIDVAATRPTLAPGTEAVTTRPAVAHGADAIGTSPIGTGQRAGFDIVALHGRQPASTQDAALRPGRRRRVVLATSVAESSLTVPGVRAVVDAGLSRAPRMDHARGLGALVTVPVSRAAATQRAGRAGREAPGRVYRCWSEAQHDRLPAQPEPEIAVADLTSFALDLALWGHPDGTGLALPDPPPAGALQTATATLQSLGALGPDGRITARGRALADAGLHPRLARALLDGAPLVGPRRAAEIVALLAEDRRTTTDDVTAAWRRARGDGDAAWRAEVRRLTAALDRTPGEEVADGALAGAVGGTGSASSGPGRGAATDRLPDDLAAGLVIGLAYPERVARARHQGGRDYLMAGGTAAELGAGSGLTGVSWLAVADADRAAGARTARIRAAAPLDEATAREVAATMVARTTEIAWADGDVVARSVERLGAITLVERRLADPDPALVRAALLDGLRTEGLGLLTWTRGATELRERLAFAHAALGEPWPDVSDESLLTRAEDWLDLGAARRRSDLARADVATGLRRLMPWSVAGRLDDVAPERLPVPSGSQVRVDYSDTAAPVLAVKVQEAFGWREAPRLAEGRVPVLLHLLSPAGRPVAVTRDLASFWAQGYPQVRAEMRGRYPRHPWPEDPTTAEPTRRANPRAR